MVAQTVTLEEIHAYFDNKLSAEDCRVFEQYIVEHPAFAEQLILYRHLYEGHEDSETREFLEKLGWQSAAYPVMKTKKRLLWGLVLSLAFLGAAVFLLFWS